MPPEDQNTGITTDTSSETSQENNENQPSVESPAPETTTQETPPLNTMAEALDAFERERVGVPTLRDPNQSPSTNGSQKKATQSRDYSGLEPDEIPTFKYMSNESYAKLYPLYLEHKKLKPEHEALKSQLEEQRSVHLYEQEGAWTLSKEYRELSSDSQRLEQEARHWEQQLENAESGNEVQLLEQDKDGNIYIGKPIPVTPGIKAQITAAMNRAAVLHARSNEKLSEYEHTFKQKHQAFSKTLKDVEAKIFSGVPAEKLDKAAKTKLELFPHYLRGQQTTVMLAKALAVIDGLSRMVDHIRANQTTNNIKAKTAATAGPTSETVQPGAGKAGTKVSDVYDDFAKARAMGIA